jgi:hypothetical protein
LNNVSLPALAAAVIEMQYHRKLIGSDRGLKRATANAPMHRNDAIVAFNNAILASGGLPGAPAWKGRAL